MNMHTNSDATPATQSCAASWRSTLCKWSAPLTIVVTALLMIWWTWGSWADVLVDFGQQLYLPWQIADGAVLYKDLAYYNGPLSQYLNAAVFYLFGASIRTLVITNMVLLALLTWVLHHAIRLVSGRLSATIACLVFVLLFAFGNYVGISNYNYVCPYAHEMTHGVLLSVASIICVWHAPRIGTRALLSGGALLGLAFLTKAEVFAAGAAGALTALILTTHPLRLKDTLRNTAWFGAAFLLPPITAFALLSTAMPITQAITGTLGSWVAASSNALGQLSFFTAGAGFQHPGENLWRALCWTGAYAAVLGPSVFLGFIAQRTRWHHLTLAMVAAAVSAAGIAALWNHISWADVARGFPIVLVLVSAALVMQRLRNNSTPDHAQQFARQISLVIFALILLSKMILNVRIYHYGFVLAMPATLVVVIAVIDWLPQILMRNAGTRLVFRAGALIVVSALTFAYLDIQRDALARKEQWVIGPRGDTLRADSVRGTIVNSTLQALQRIIQPAQTLAALPEGAMLNFLLRRRNPTRFSNLMPPEMVMFGEEVVLANFQRHPPDWIALVHKDTSEFGFRFFGRDYGQKLFSWLARSYRHQSVIGAPPLQTNRPGIVLLRRIPSKQVRGRQSKANDQTHGAKGRPWNERSE